MKTQLTWLYAILLLAGMAFTQTLKAQALIPAPGLYTTVPKGYQALSNVALSDTTTWFRWSQDSAQISISLKMLSSSGKYKIKLARLYAAKAGGQIGLINEELLRTSDSTIYFYTRGLNPGTDIYLNIITEEFCPGCSPASSMANIVFAPEAAGCVYTQRTCDLVRDGDMEAFTACNAIHGVSTEDPYGDWTLCHWQLPNSNNGRVGTADYFNTCAPTIGGTNGTNNVFSMCLPGVGPQANTGYAGILVYDNFDIIGWREYLVNHLNAPMLAGKTYSISLWVRLANVSKYAIKDISMLLTNNIPVQSLNGNIPTLISAVGGELIPEFTINPITDKTNWTHLSLVYTPAATYDHITIGNFKSEAGTVFTDLDQSNFWTYTTSTGTGSNCNYHNKYSYYYIDNVSIRPINLDAGPDKSICPTGSVTLTSSLTCPPAGGTVSYNWSPSGSLTTPGASSTGASPSVTTTYVLTATITFTDGTAPITLYDNVTVTVTDPPSFTLTASASPNPICAGSSATLSTNAGSNLSYTWTSVAGTYTVPNPVVSPAVTTTYSVATVNCGHTYTAVVTLTVNPAPTFSVSSNVACEGSSVAVTTASSTTINFIDFGDQFSTTNVINPHAYSTAGTYSITIDAYNSAGSCNTHTVIPITVVSSQSLTLNVTSTPCTNNYTFTANFGCTNNAYTNVFSIDPLGVIVGPQADNDFPYTFTSPGTYTVSLISSFDDYEANPSVVVTITNVVTPTVTASASPSVICAGQITSLSASGASTYTWQPGGATGSPVAFSPTVSTVYTVTGTNSQGCTGTKTVAVTVNGLPSLSVTASPTAICAGSTTTLTASGASTYTWNTGQTMSTIVVAPSTTTVYTVTGTNASGCTNTKTITVNVTANPGISAVPSANSICAGGSATLTASAGASSYTWNPGALTGSVVVVTPTTTTVYTLSAAVPGCGTKTSTIQISVNPLSITASASPTAICSGKSATLTASGANTYTWNPGGLTGSSVVITSTVTGTTVYTVTGVNLYGCTATQTLSLTTNVNPNVIVTPSSGTICATSSYTIRALNAGTSFVWMPGGATTSSIIITPTVSTVYTVTGTNNTTGCSGTQTASVVVNPFTLVTANPSTICAGQSATLSAQGASSYTWSTGANTSSITVSPTVTSAYTVTGTGSGCTVPLTLTLTVNPVPSLTASASPTAICSGQSATLTASGAGSYTWNPGGATTNPLTVSPGSTTVYTVTGSSLGCSSSKTVSLNVSPTPTISVSGQTMTCIGFTPTLTASGASTYSWSTGATSNTISMTYTAPTTVNYTVTGTTGSCTSSKTIKVYFLTPPAITAVASPSTICAGSYATLIGFGGSSGTYTWMPGSININPLTISPPATTVYTVTARNGGCSGTNTVQLTVIPTLSISANAVTLCSGNSATLTASGVPNYTWSTGANTASIVVTPSATTVYTVTGTNGACTNSLTVTVQVNATPPVSIGSSTTNVCTGGTATLTAGGATSYTWSTGPTTASVSVSPTVTTSYTVTGVNAAGCTNMAVSTITATPSSTISLSCSTSTAYAPSGSAVTASAVVSPPGTYDYVWEPNIGSSAVVTFTPTDNTVLNCSVSGLCANTVSSSCCVSLESSLCAVTSNTTLSNLSVSNVTVTATSQTITINGTLSIGSNSSVVFSGCVLKMGTGAKIVVAPTSSLSVSSTTVFSCEGMWEGIELQSNAVSSATIELKNAMIEDAYTAISADNASANLNNNIIVGVSTLNKNYMDIAIKNAGGAARYPLTMYTSSLTSNASTTSPGNNLKCSGFYSPTVKARSYAGVYAVNGGTVDVNNNNDKTSVNLFSNKDYGVYLDNTGSSIYYARFADAIGLSYTYSLSLSPSVSGVGVYSKNSDYLNVMPPTTPTTGIVTTFTNMGYGVVTNNTKSVDIENSDYSASSQSNIMDPYTYNTPEWATPLPVHYAGNGLNGIFVTDPTDLLRITNNSLSQSYYAVTVNYTTPPAASNIMSVAQNTITATGSGQVREGVTVNSAVSFTPTANNMRVTVNTFSNVIIGVKAMNSTTGLRISNNSILLNPSGGGAPRGIYLLGSNDVIADNNSINGGYTGSSGSAYSTSNVGVLSEASPGCKIKCNTITQTGIGVQYMYGNSSPGDGLFGNTFTYPMRRGLWLSKGGLMGVQGNSVSASANVWSGFTNDVNVDQTYVGGAFTGSNPASVAANSPLWVRNTATELPTDNNFTLPSGVGDVYNFSSFTLSPSASDYSPGCPATLTAGLRVSHDTSSADNSDRDADFMNYIQHILPASNTDVTPQDKYLLKRYMFTALNREPSTDAHLVDFYQRQLNTSIDSYHAIDSLLAAGDVYTAGARNTSAPVDNDITQTQNAYNALYVNGIHSAGELKDLEAIADLCPAQYGTAVYQARALLQTLTYQYKQYNDSCGDDKTNARFGDDNQQESVSVSGGVVAKLLPNPNSGAFTLAYDLKAHAKATITVADITGKLVYSSTVDNLNNRKQIHTEYLQEGIYFIQLLDGDTLLWTDKLIISK